MWIAPANPENTKELDTVFAIAEAVMGFVPNSMLIMAHDPELLAAFAELSAIIVVRPGRLSPGLKALIMYMVSRSGGCQYCAAHSANLAALRKVPTRKIEALGQFERSAEFNEAERAALRFAQAAGQVPNAVGHTEFAELRRHFDDNQILEMVAVLALLGFLNRWNDILATPLEAGPRNFAECHLAATGWKIGKHADTMPLDPSPGRTIPLSGRLFLWRKRVARRRPRARSALTIQTAVSSWFVSQMFFTLLATRSKEDLTIIHKLIKAGKVTPVIEKCYSLR